LRAVLRLVLSDLAHDLLHTLFSAVGIAAVVMGTLLLNALSSGLSSFMAAAPLNTNLLLVDAVFTHPTDSTISPKVLAALQAWTPDPIRQISPSFYRQLRVEGRLTQVRAAVPADWPTVYSMTLVDGRWAAANDEIVVGEGLTSALGWQVGSTLVIYGKAFTISGIYRAPGSGFTTLWMSMDAALALFGPQRSVQMLTLVLAPGVDPAAVSRDLQASPALAGDYTIFMRDIYTLRNGQVVRDVYAVAALISVLTLLAVPLSTYSMTLLSLVERARALGILRAIGFSHQSVFNYLLLRALLLAFGAYLLGLGAALVYISLRQAGGPIFMLGARLEFSLTGSQAVMVLAITLFFALTGAWLSSLRLLRLSANDLLRD